MSGAQILFGLAFFAAAAYTVVGYPHKYGALTGRSRFFRTIGLFLLDLLLALVLLYTFVDFNRETGGPVASIRELLYLLSCFFLGLMLVCLAILDALESVVAVRRERRAAMQEMIRAEIERAEREKAGAAARGEDNGPGGGGAA